MPKLNLSQSELVVLESVLKDKVKYIREDPCGHTLSEIMDIRSIHKNVVTQNRKPKRKAVS